VASPAPLPDRIADEVRLEELLGRPSPADIAFARMLGGDVLVLGAGGKMGPSLARRVRRACQAAGVERRVIAVSRFAEPALARALAEDGITALACDLLDPDAVARLPEAGEVLYLAGRKFGSDERPDLTWAQNAMVPVWVGRRYASARIVAFSSGNVFAPVGPGSRGSTEDDPPGPVGEYAQSVLARERVFEYFSRERGTPVLLLRLFYAVDLRYGTLADIAGAVFEGRPVDVTVGRVNAIWQGDANSYAFRALALAASPARRLVVTGPEAIGVREAAEWFGARFGRAPRLQGREGPTALLGDASRCVSLLGPPEVGLDRLLGWTADWVAQGGRSLGKPTHFEATDGRY
jgi:nucleoside-diphosphate-sugar epimerase